MPKAPKSLRELLQDLLLAVAEDNKKSTISLIKKIISVVDNQEKIQTVKPVKKVVSPVIEPTEEKEVVEPEPMVPKRTISAEMRRRGFTEQVNTFNPDEYQVDPEIQECDEIVSQKPKSSVARPQEGKSQLVEAKCSAPGCNKTRTVEAFLLNNSETKPVWYCGSHQLNY